jgi:L-amino acid N-acyltransferase YncA
MQIRIAAEGDCQQIAEIYAPIVAHTHISFELVPPTAGEIAKRMAAVLENHVWLVAEEAGRVDGYAYAGAHRDRAAYGWSTDTTVYIRDGARAKGIGRSLYSSLLRILAAQNYRRAFAGIALPNPGSIALHEAVGFRHIGTYPGVGFKFGRWHDVGWWSFPLDDRDGAPEPVAPLKKLGDLRKFLA